MKSGGKKGIIIASIVIILIVIIVAGGVFAYVTTDLFKSNQTLFFQYMGQAIESFDYVENTQMKEIAKKKQEMPYTLEGTLQSIEGENKIHINASVNNPEEKAYAKANLSYKDQELFSVEYANSNHIYALKSPEIITAFLGVENGNLKVLAQKLGILDTTIIPDSMKQVNLEDLLIISQEEKEHMKETYLPVLIKNIEKNNFKKEKDVSISKKDINYVTTAYHLQLSKEEQKQVVIAILQTLKEDSITLNLIATKAKLLGLDENYTQINRLTNKIQTKISDIQSETTLEEGLLSITIYTNKGEVIVTEIVQDDTKYTIYGDKKENVINRNLLIEKLNKQEENNKIEISLKETRKEAETIYDILINMDNKTGINIYIENIGTAAEEKIKTKGEISVSEREETATVYYEQQTNFVEKVNNIIELDRNNCGVLNDYTTEQLQPLLQAVKQRTIDVLKQKVQFLMNIRIQQLIERSINANEEMKEAMREEKIVFNEFQDEIQQIIGN